MPSRSLDAIEGFLTAAGSGPISDSVLATLLFTDIVESTSLAAGLGDRDWAELLGSHDVVVRHQLRRFRGREVKHLGDGFLATFDGPARAIHCARAIVEAARGLGIEVRAGLHTGECGTRGSGLHGVAVHIGARVTGHAGAGEILVTGTVKDLVVGSGIAFHERGTHTLKGVPGEWPLYVASP
jgi:class 3 adenylate cyclase